jgi:hypothetical protein
LEDEVSEIYEKFCPGSPLLRLDQGFVYLLLYKHNHDKEKRKPIAGIRAQNPSRRAESSVFRSLGLKRGRVCQGKSVALKMVWKKVVPNQTNV